jgi:hypothetical protein
LTKRYKEIKKHGKLMGLPKYRYTRDYRYIGDRYKENRRNFKTLQ